MRSVSLLRPVSRSTAAIDIIRGRFIGAASNCGEVAYKRGTQGSTNRVHAAVELDSGLPGVGRTANIGRSGQFDQDKKDDKMTPRAFLPMLVTAACLTAALPVSATTAVAQSAPQGAGPSCPALLSRPSPGCRTRSRSPCVS